jgi:uncharacterized protein YegP (UPF0339 family)
MSDKFTRISLEQAGDGLTDWTALASLTDVQVDARALLDSDTLLPGAKDLGLGHNDGRSDPAVEFLIYKDKSGDFRWRLSASDGTLFAVCPEGFATKAKALGSVRMLLAALGKVERLAA